MQWLDTETTLMRIGTITVAKSERERDATRWARLMSPTVPATASSRTGGPITTVAAGSANAPSMNTTNHATANSADVFATKAAAVRCTTCAVIFRRTAGVSVSIEVLSARPSVRDYAAVTS